MNRREALKIMLAASMAPAIVKADSIMRISVPKIARLDVEILRPDNYITKISSGNRIITLDEITRDSLKILRKHVEVFITEDGCGTGMIDESREHEKRLFRVLQEPIIRFNSA